MNTYQLIFIFKIIQGQRTEYYAYTDYSSTATTFSTDSTTRPYLVTENPFKQCTVCVDNVDIDGSVFRKNVVKDDKSVTNEVECQKSCASESMCQYFVFEKVRNRCTLYKNNEYMEFDDDADEGKCTGFKTGCLGDLCMKKHWSYKGSGESLVRDRAVHHVESIQSCLEICRLSSECAKVSFKTESQKCYLKNEDVSEQNLETDFDYDSAGKCCIADSCILRGVEYEDVKKMWIVTTRFDIIGKQSDAFIPSVASPEKCDQICTFIERCNFWTYKESENKCYLAKSPKDLNWSSSKVGGQKGCTQEKDLYRNTSPQFGESVTNDLNC